MLRLRFSNSRSYLISCAVEPLPALPPFPGSGGLGCALRRGRGAEADVLACARGATAGLSARLLLGHSFHLETQPITPAGRACTQCMPLIVYGSSDVCWVQGSIARGPQSARPCGAAHLQQHSAYLAPATERRDSWEPSQPAIVTVFVQHKAAVTSSLVCRCRAQLHSEERQLPGAGRPSERRCSCYGVRHRWGVQQHAQPVRCVALMASATSQSGPLLLGHVFDGF